MARKSLKLSTLDVVILLAVMSGVIFYDASSFSIAIKASLLCLIGFASVYFLVKVFQWDGE